VLVVLAAALSIAPPTWTAFAPPLARADGTADGRAAAIKELMSPDDAVRANAAAFLVQQGRAGAEELARHAELDDRALKACAEAYARGWRVYAYSIVVAARTAAPAHAKRLMELAHAVNPLAGVQRTHDETAAEVRRLVDEAARSRCGTGYAEEIALLGHDAVEPLLAGIRGAEHEDGSIECWAVELLAEKADLPAIRELIIAGKVNLVDAVERMRKDGVPEATQVLLDAAAAGRFGFRIARALAETPDHARVIEVVNTLLKARPDVADQHHASLAWMLKRLDARESVSTLESWIATSSDSNDFVEIGDALVHFGSRKGVGVLVRIASERRTRFPCRPSTPKELAAASAPGRLRAEGFSSDEREAAAKTLAAIAGKAVFDMPDDLIRHLAAQGRDHESEDDYLDRAAAAFRAWWEASKDRLRFDAATGRWIVGD